MTDSEELREALDALRAAHFDAGGTACDYAGLGASPEKQRLAETLRTLTRRSDAAGALRLAIHLGLLLAGGALVWASRGTWWMVPAVALQGWFVAALFAPLHEAVHYTAFRTRRGSRLFASKMEMKP